MDLQDFIRENSTNLQQYMPQIDEDLIPAKKYAVNLNITPQTVINQLKSKRLDDIQIGKRWFVKVKKNDSDLRYKHTFFCVCPFHLSRKSRILCKVVE